MTTLEKFAVYDDRIVQNAPSYAVYKGGESVTATQFRAISANTSQHNFNVTVPSPNIYIDRAVDWVSDCMLVFNVAVANGAGQAGITAANAGTIPVITFGKDCALSAFPLHTMTNTMSASINDVTVSMNTAELLPQLLRMVDYKANLKQRTCPSMLDTFASYNDAYGSFSSPLNSYFESVVQGNYCPNGAYNRIAFCNPNNGTILNGNGSYTYNGTQVWYNNGIPQCANANAVGAGWVLNPNLAAMPIGIRFTSAEKLVLPPFIFSDSKELTTGLFGINAFQLTCNMISSAGLQRVIRSTSANYRTVSNVAFIENGFANSQLNVEFITPSLSIPLPPVSSVPWMEMPRYTTAVSINASQTAVVQSNNYVLSAIPDYFMIFVKPQMGQYGATDADYLLPISNISLNFNNFAGLMTTMTLEQLYHMSVQNGLDSCDFNMFCGKGRIAPANSIAPNVGSGANLVGAPLIIRPGKDFALSQGLAAGVNGNFNLQFALTITNNSTNNFNQNCLIYLVAINSGFFESHGGSSRIIKAPLNEADVISASAVNPMGKQRLERMVGGGFFDKIGSVLNKASHIYGLTKPYVSAIKGALPEGKIKSVLGSVGYGKHGESKMAQRIVKVE